MIAKILYYPDKEREGRRAEHLVEFRTLCVTNPSDEFGGAEFDFDMPGHEKFRVPTDGSAQVYIMNNDGKTVESYSWGD